MYYNEHTIIYHNGAFVKASEAKIDLYSQSMHYGYSVFEGIRSYRTEKGTTKIFKPVAHFERLQASAKSLNMPYPWSVDELIAATYEVLVQNDIQNAYIRPLVYAPANMSFAPNTTSYIAIQAWEMPPFFGEKLLRVATSSFQRPNPKGFHITAKAGGHYVNSLLASQEAKAKGYDEALLNDIDGNVAEATGANVFFEKNGVLYTPSLGSILPGITRATVLEICQTLNIEVLETKFTVDEMYGATCAFFCGTAAEIIGIESIDDQHFSQSWNNSLGKIIQTAYKNLVIELPVSKAEILGVE